MSAPERLTVWVCPRGKHVEIDRGGDPLSVTGSTTGDPDRVPLCNCYQTDVLNDHPSRRMRRVVYEIAPVQKRLRGRRRGEGHARQR